MSLKYMAMIAIGSSLLLAGCGSDDTTTGTGGTSNPSLTGVVSSNNGNEMTVGTVTYDTTGAEIVNDSSTGIEPGMVVTVNGPHSDGHGVAHTIKHDSEVEGVVISSNITLLPDSDPMTYEGTMNVMGQAIIIDSMTMFKDFDDPTMIAMGTVVEISGMFEDDGIHAKRVKYKAAELLPDEEVEIKGYVSAYDEVEGTFMLGECQIIITPDTKFDDIDVLEDGMKVEVESVGSMVMTDPMCKVEAIEIENEDHDGYHDMAKAEGMVVGDLVDNMFMLQYKDMDPVKVMVDDNTHYMNGTVDNIVDGAKLKAVGMYNEDDVLMAKLIKFEDMDMMNVKGEVVSEYLDNMFDVKDKDGNVVTVLVTADTKYLHGSDADIVLGAMLKAVGMFDDMDRLVASMIKFEDMGGKPPMPGVPPMIKYDGSVEAVELADGNDPTLGGTLKVLGQMITVTADTKIYKEVMEPMPVDTGTGVVTTMATMPPEIMLTLADIMPGDYVMVMPYYDDMGNLIARVIEVKPAPDMPMSKVFGPITAADAGSDTMMASMVVAGVTVVIDDMTEITPMDKYDITKIADAILAGTELKALVKGTYDMTTGELTATHIAVHELSIM